MTPLKTSVFFDENHLWLAGQAESLEAGIVQARSVLDNSRAYEQLTRLQDWRKSLSIR